MQMPRSTQLILRIKTIIVLSLLVFFIGCNPDDEVVNINGEYIGFFDRNGNQAAVNITFNEGIFDGVSEFPQFPAICNGTYMIAGNTITFDNGCIWTADFDWTLILDGTWNVEQNGNELILVNAEGDQYTMTR